MYRAFKFNLFFKFGTRDFIAGKDIYNELCRLLRHNFIEAHIKLLQSFRSILPLSTAGDDRIEPSVKRLYIFLYKCPVDTFELVNNL